MPSKPLPLIVIGLIAGFFSGVFGVGGGILIVPLLVGLCAYPPKTAMATSLAAILFTASAAAASHALDGNVAWTEGALIGLPAVAGAIGGAALHQQVNTRPLVLGFSAFLILVAARLAL
ncbi:MAG: TSUP family transporter [Gaiellales bacterium]